ncbi:MAG: glycosyltransferase family 4 protein [Deltaproteobacteria bacterium]|nr:glycosyltransferase family 4 protein [Deltaproteobacteria bacterium]
MVDALVRLVPPMMLDQTFLLLRHPLARARLSDSPNVTEVTLQAEANGPGTLWLLPRLVDLRSVRLFHAPSNILPAGLAMPTVTTVHDLMWLLHPELCRVPGPWGHVETMFYRDGIRRALRRSTRLVAISQATLADIRAVDRCAAQRCTVVAHGIEPVFSPSQGDQDQQECERVRATYAPGAARHVLAVGRSAPYKNHRKVVEAFLLAFGEDPATHLILIQRLGTEAQGLLELARALGAEGRVHVLPSLALQDLIALYRGALCLCQPSIIEGWGMPVGEALACGCPVVASRCAALREVLGEAAEYVDPHSTVSIAGGLRRIARDASARGRLIDAGLRRAREFTWQEYARAMAMVYRECLETPKAAGELGTGS